MGFFGNASLRAREHPIAFAAAAVSIAVLAIVALMGVTYLLSPVAPYGFYYDLGVDVLATSTIAHWIGGFADFKDALGWAGWGDRSAFAFAPMTSVAISVFFAKLFDGDAFEAVKCVQVFEVLISAASAFWLYRVLRGRSAWAWAAASIYALLAEQLLMIRGNLSFGFTAALAPLALGVPLVLVRRCRLLALPLCGAIVSLLGAYFTTEHLFLQSLPAYAFAVVLAYDSRRVLAWAIASIGGLAIVFASLAYVVLPTEASNALFSPTATVGAALGGGEFAHYSNGLLSLASLCITEFIHNGRKAFSLGPLLFLTVPVGLALWGFAIAWVTGSMRRRSFAWGEAALGATGLVCVLLSTGSFVPGVNVLWWIVSQLPVLDNIRTPDRFVALGVVVVVIFAVSQLERLSYQPRAAGYAMAAAAVLPIAGLVLFFLVRVLSGDTTPVDQKEPYLGTIDALAQARGNRVANLALTDKGSVFDTPLYGMPTPFLDFQNDFAERYEGDGLGGAGMLARGDVATIVATPPWTPDSPLLGQSSLVRAAILSPLAGDATTVTAYGVRPVRGYVHAVDRACLAGGPGLLDTLVAMPAFSDTAFLLYAPRCKRAFYADSEPLSDAVGGNIVYQWPSIALFPRSGVMRDIDYRLSFGRFFINVPWYRNAIDGDSTVFSNAAVSLDSGDAASSVFEAAAAGSYSLAMHVVCHGSVAGSVQVDRTRHAFACRPGLGFQWIDVPVGRLAPGLHELLLRFDTIDTSSLRYPTTWRLAFDGAAIVRKMAVTRPPVLNGFAFSAERFRQRTTLPEPAGRLTFVSARGMDRVGPGAADGGPALLARASNAVATYRWTGSTGRYRVWADAYTEGGYQGANYVAVYGAGACCLGVSTSGASRGTTMLAYGDVSLHDGSVVHVLVHTAPGDAAAIAQLLSVIAEPDPMPARPAQNRSLVSADFDFLARSQRVDPEVPTWATPVPGHDDMDPFYGVPVSAPLRLHVVFPPGTSKSPTTLHVAGDYGNSAIAAQLSCGNRTVRSSFTAAGDVALGPANSRDCTVTLSSRWATLYVADVQVSRSIRSYDLTARRWISAGRYRVLPVRRGGGPAGGVISIDGKASKGVVTVARGGEHAIAWQGAPADAYLLALVPTKWPQHLSAIAFRQTASARWNVRVRRASTFEAAVFPDGNWRLVGDGRSLSGARCDLENTCFHDVPPGRYLLLHLWPGYIDAGFAIALLAWVCAIAAYVYATRRTAE